MLRTTTQQRHPWRASLRTTLQTAAALVAALLAAAPLVQDFMAQFWPDSPVLPWVAGAVVFLSALSGLLARLAALPAVDAVLERIGLGSAPHVGEQPTSGASSERPASRAPPEVDGGSARF